MLHIFRRTIPTMYTAKTVTLTGIKFYTVPYAISYVVFSGNSEISSNLRGFGFWHLLFVLIRGNK